MRRPVRTLLLAVLPLVAFGGCAGKDNDADVVAGKTLFVKKCGSCHVLNRAGTKGTTGPNLDQAFHQDVKEGFGESAIRGVVKKQILYPNRLKDQGGIMPAKLVKGRDADNIAAYVASVVAQPGKDTGLLAAAGQAQQSKKPAVAKNGVLSIPADPGGGLAYVFATAEAPAGQISIEMPNKSGVPHNIAIDGLGKGAIVPNGVSKFSADLKPGKYTYYCQVPGHLQAGMKGTLTVK